MNGDNNNLNNDLTIQMDHFDSTKQTLQMRLQQRRSRQVLCEQGILPPLSVPGKHYMQMQQLSRKMAEDKLNKAIQRRPGRQYLVDKHILEETDVASSIVANQKCLKKAKLVDDLNEKIQCRPGVIELVEKKIIPADNIQNALRDGQLQYKKIDEDSFDDDSSDAFSPEQLSFSPQLSQDQFSPPTSQELSQFSPPSGDPLSFSPPHQETINFSPGDPSPPHSIQPHQRVFVANHVLDNQGKLLDNQLGNGQLNGQLNGSSSHQMTIGDNQNLFQIQTAHATKSIKPKKSSSSTNLFKSSSSSSLFNLNGGKSSSSSSLFNQGSHPYLSRQSSKGSKNSFMTSSRSSGSRKKKEKTKIKTFKYHQYIPPTQGKQKKQSDEVEENNMDTNYARRLEQQQIYLQYQIITENNNIMNNNQMNDISTSSVYGKQSPQLSTFSNVKLEPKLKPLTQTKLDEMKVSELKEQLKARQLKVTGTKEVLVDRLRPYCVKPKDNDFAIFSNMQTEGNVVSRCDTPQQQKKINIRLAEPQPQKINIRLPQQEPQQLKLFNGNGQFSELKNGKYKQEMTIVSTNNQPMFAIPATTFKVNLTTPQVVSQDSKVHVVMPTTQIVQMTPSNSITMTTNTQQHSNEDLIHEKMLKQQQEIDKLKQQLLSKEKQVQILQNQQLFQTNGSVKNGVSKINGSQQINIEMVPTTNNYNQQNFDDNIEFYSKDEEMTNLDEDLMNILNQDLMKNKDKNHDADMQITSNQLPSMYKIVSTMNPSISMATTPNIPSNPSMDVKRTLLETNGDALLDPNQLPPINNDIATFTPDNFNFSMATDDNSSHGNNMRVPPTNGDGSSLGDFSFDVQEDTNNNSFHGNQLGSLRSNQGSVQGNQDPARGLEDMLSFDLNPDFPQTDLTSDDMSFMTGDFMKQGNLATNNVMTTSSDPFNTNILSENGLSGNSLNFDYFNNDLLNTFNST